MNRELWVIRDGVITVPGLAQPQRQVDVAAVELHDRLEVAVPVQVVNEGGAVAEVITNMMPGEMGGSF